MFHPKGTIWEIHWEWLLTLLENLQQPFRGKIMNDNLRPLFLLYKYHLPASGQGNWSDINVCWIIELKLGRVVSKPRKFNGIAEDRDFWRGIFCLLWKIMFHLCFESLKGNCWYSHIRAKIFWRGNVSDSLRKALMCVTPPNKPMRKYQYLSKNQNCSVKIPVNSLLCFFPPTPSNECLSAAIAASRGQLLKTSGSS